MVKKKVKFFGNIPPQNITITNVHGRFCITSAGINNSKIYKLPNLDYEF